MATSIDKYRKAGTRKPGERPTFLVLIQGLGQGGNAPTSISRPTPPLLPAA